MFIRGFYVFLLRPATSSRRLAHWWMAVGEGRRLRPTFLWLCQCHAQLKLIRKAPSEKNVCIQFSAPLSQSVSQSVSLAGPGLFIIRRTAALRRSGKSRNLEPCEFMCCVCGIMKAWWSSVDAEIFITRRFTSSGLDGSKVPENFPLGYPHPKASAPGGMRRLSRVRVCIFPKPMDVFKFYF